MANVTGVVESTSNKFGKFSVLVNGVWYGTKEEWAPKPTPNKGDTVSFDDGGKKFLKGLKIMNASEAVGSTATASVTNNYHKKSRGSFPIDPLDGQISIIRQNALTNAIKYAEYNTQYTASKIPLNINTIIQIAKDFEQYTAGFADLKEAEKEAKEMLKTVED